MLDFDLGFVEVLIKFVGLVGWVLVVVEVESVGLKMNNKVYFGVVILNN